MRPPTSDAAGGEEPFPAALRRLRERRLPPSVPEGLRERKKRQLRQLISDTATAMFLERGFDAVRVSEVAEACDVSEKTVFNYFPTKEALVFDREEDQAALIREAIHDHGDGTPLVQAIVAVIEREVDWVYDEWARAGGTARELTGIRRFAEMVEDTPALTDAMHAMSERLRRVAAEALAERAGVDPEDPEPQIASGLVTALWSTQFRAMVRYSDGTLEVAEVRAGVLDEVHRAAQVADTGLSSFDAATRFTSGTAQLREAAEAADQARRQVVAAVRQARDAWKQILNEIQAHHEVGGGPPRGVPERELRERQREMRAEIRRRQDELRRRQAQRRREQAEARRGHRSR